jgi:hypothetical protein
MLLLQACHINYEPIFHVAPHHSLVRLADCRHRDHFNVARDAFLRTVIQHLLSLSNSADEGAAQGSSAEYQRKGAQWARTGEANQHHLAVQFQQSKVLSEIVLSRNRVQQKIKLTGMSFEYRRIVCGDKVVRPHALASASLDGEWLKTVT